MLAERPVADATAVWARLKGVHGLPFASQCAALALVRWREAAAQRSDRPRRWLLADDALLAIAAALPRDADALAALAQSKFIARSARRVLAAIAVARRRRAASRSARERRTSRCPTSAVKALQERVRQRAAALGIEPEILATKRDLVGLALGDPPLHLRTGWRAKELPRVSWSASHCPRSRAHRRSRDRREYVPVGCVRDVLSRTLPGAPVCTAPRAAHP